MGKLGMQERAEGPGGRSLFVTSGGKSSWQLELGCVWGVLSLLGPYWRRLGFYGALTPLCPPPHPTWVTFHCDNVTTFHSVSFSRKMSEQHGWTYSCISFQGLSLCQAKRGTSFTSVPHPYRSAFQLDQRANSNRERTRNRTLFLPGGLAVQNITMRAWLWGSISSMDFRWTLIFQWVPSGHLLNPLNIHPHIVPFVPFFWSCGSWFFPK